VVDDPPNSTDDPATTAANGDAARDLWAIVTELPPKQRVLLVALFRDELNSYREVATRCAMPIGSIGPTRARALVELRRRLADRGFGPADL
jgi:DNA-directed RNA polymerase specialized sigma24 family protein